MTKLLKVLTAAIVASFFFGTFVPSESEAACIKYQGIYYLDGNAVKNCKKAVKYRKRGGGHAAARIKTDPISAKCAGKKVGFTFLAFKKGRKIRVRCTNDMVRRSSTSG